MTRFWGWAAAFFLGLTFTSPAPATDYGAPPPEIATYLDALVAAYPDHLVRHDGKTLFWRDGTEMVISDGDAAKDFEALLNRPDLDDMFAFAYPAGGALASPPENVDPGRVRYEPLFVKMYGNCHSGEVGERLRAVPWLPKHGGGTVRITTVNGVDRALAAVSAELDDLPENYMRYLIPSAGTYNCRTIAGTDRFSVHAFGAAIDISTKTTNYWRWTKPDASGAYPWRNQVPDAIVRIFEKHGFIWGGRWYHYDTMHFEYRPELLGPR
ncbi:MAG: M15 family metallopeptidase [Magnetospiraceae bacterium]